MADEFTTPDFHLNMIFLPVGNLELNPTEMVWSIIKRHAFSRNLKFRLSGVEMATKQHIEGFSRDEFKTFAAHAFKEEERFKEMASITDETQNEVESDEV